MRPTWFFAAVGATALLAACVTARPAPDPVGDAAAARGQAFAARQCASCHAVGLEGFSPRADAPPFLTLRRGGEDQRLDWRLERVAAVAAVGHYAMPAKTMSPQEVADVAAYLRWLAP